MTHNNQSYMDAALEEFRQKLTSEWKRTNYKDQIFYLPKAIKAWMAAGDRQNAALLLEAVYKDRGFRRDITVAQLFKEQTRCIIVFAILVSLNYGHLISVFHQHNITDYRVDHDIDIQNSNLSRALRNERVDPIKVLTEFEDRKWSFTPVNLTYLMHPSLSGSKWILPFKEFILIGEGGTAKVYQVLVEGCLLPRDFRELVREASNKVADLAGFYEFAIKEYDHNHAEHFKREREAFMAIRGQEGMVQCLGDFEHHQQAAQGPQTTYNILLEFGQFHLGEFFAEPQTYPPVLQQEILLFWKKFFKVADAISSIHELTHTTEGGSTRRYNGWHADIKPENIMRVYGEFKLSDFGFAKFANYSNRPLSYIDGGTATYGAPEMDTERRMRGTKTALTQAIDVWSFACVLSVTATWAILGVQGVLQYEQVRESAIRDLPGDRRPSSSAAFHNGTKVLPEVLEWHQLLRTCRRESDPITDKILDLIDDRMLLADPDERIPIKELCSKRDALVEEAERALKRPEVQVSQPILEKLLQFDREPPTTSSKEDEGSTMYPARNARGKESQGKSRLPKENSVPQAKPGKVVYRAEALSTALEGVKDIQRQTRATDPGTTAETNNEFTSFLTWSPVDVTPSGRGQQATDPMQTKLPGEPHPAEGNPRREPGLTAQEFPNPPTNEARDGRTRVVTASPETFTSPRLSSIVSGSAVGYPDPIAGEISASDSQRVGPYTVQRTLMHLQTGRSLSTAPEVVLSPSPTRAPLVMSSPTSSAPRFNTEGTRPCPLYSPYGHYQTKAESFAMFKERKELEGRVRKSWSFRKQERDKDLKKIIEDRDIVFVVDRSSTMGQCWPWVTFWVETLAMKLARLDDDGLDLVFTGSGNLDHMGCKHAKEFKTRMDKAQRELDPMPTDMAGCLSRIFSTYRQNRKYARRALTLIVVTDGSWSVPANRQRGNKVEDNIVDFVNELQRTSQDVHDKVKYRRWFSIQFVSFATDPVAHANLKHLDSVMWKERGIPDVIDTKPWDHSIVNNLILGSLHEFADDSDEEPSTAVTGSTSAWRHP